MIKVDLITGFLGSGKTTFIKRYCSYCMEQGESICILENDYGAVNVDMMLLKELECEKCDLEMIAGGCDADCHRRRFKTKLITMAMFGYDRVIIEPSGIFDVDEFFDLLHEEPIDGRYEIDHVITVVRGNLEENMTPDSDYLLASQIADAGAIVFSHMDETQEDKLIKTIAHINRALKQIKCKRVLQREDPDLFAINMSDFTDEDLKNIQKNHYQKYSYEKMFSMDQNQFDSMFFMNLEISLEDLKMKIPLFFQNPELGNIIRVKGFYYDPEKELWYELNGTSDGLEIDEIPEGQNILIVIGENLNKKKLESFL